MSERSPGRRAIVIDLSDPETGERVGSGRASRALQRGQKDDGS
jgi:hypothetical protein